MSDRILQRPLPLLGVSLEAVVGNRLGAGVYRRWVRSLCLAGDEHVLDIGTGAGACARHVAAALPAGRLVCLDIDPRWLAIAQRRLAEFGDRVEFVAADAAEWSRREAFEVVTAHFVLHDIESTRRCEVLLRVAESLRPHGRLCLREPVTHGVTARELQDELLAAGLKPLRPPSRGRVPLMGETIEGVWTT